jgi:pyruvate-formate lyase-activating enzyme
MRDEDAQHMKWFTRKTDADEDRTLEELWRPGTSKAAAAACLDVLQRQFHRVLAERYGDGHVPRLLALKLTNLAAGRYHFANRHRVLFGHPVQLMVDPANACQLACPGCVHSANVPYASALDWPRVTLPLDTYEALMNRFGPFAFCASLYNYGEPLLNKRFAEFVRMSKEYLLYTMASTNLSMPLSDVDAIVASGLDYLILSIDGTDQPVYERYRRKGDLNLVLGNVAKLVEAKQRLGSETPYLVWQFLTFEHNEHQVTDALKIGPSLGVNALVVATPFRVDGDDPTIRVVESPHAGLHIFRPWNGQWCSPAIRSSTGRRAAQIDAAFAHTWASRLESMPGMDEQPSAAGTCSWLYFNLTLDGAGRAMPCCMAPDKNEKRLVFTAIGPTETRSALEIVNSPMATLAREAFADREAYDRKAPSLPAAERPYCATCTESPRWPYGVRNIRDDIRAIDPSGAIADDVIAQLTGWN